MDYTTEQLTDALVNEWRLLCLEEYDEDDASPEEYRESLEGYSYEQLVEEMIGEKELETFMEQYKG